MTIAAPNNKSSTTSSTISTGHPKFYIWRQRMLYLGSFHKPRVRRYDAPYLAFGFQGPLRFQLDGQSEPIECRVAVIPPATEVFFGAEGETNGMLFLDYLGQDLKLMKTLARKSSGALHYDFGQEREASWLSQIARLHATNGGIDQASELLDLLNFRRYESEFESDLPDARLCKIIDLYLSGQLSQNCRVSDVAASVNLSVPRIVQLFREHLGISFRTFRSRQRLHRFMLATAFGLSHCDAALEAGFVDQPHFCKQFKKATGINASQYFLRINEAQYFVEAALAEMFINGCRSSGKRIPTQKSPH